MCAFALPAAAQAAPWACDGAGYTSQFDGENPELGTLLFRVEQQPDGSLERVQIGSLPEEHFNAIGFRPQDGFMYGLNQTTGEIMRISDDGSGAPEFESIGFPAGAAVTASVVGTILNDGTYFIWAGEQGSIFDVSGPTATLVENVTAATAEEVPGGDMAVSPIDGELYAASPDIPGQPAPRDWGVYRFSLEGGVLTREERYGDAAAPGGQWFVSDGRHIQYNNSPPEPGPNGNGLYALDLETGELTFHGSGPAFSNADGTGCANGLAVTKDADPRTVVAGTQVTYTHTISSRALEDAPVEFADVLPAGMTYVSGGVTVSPPSFGTPNAYAGTDTLEIPGTMAPGETITITATAAVPSSTDCGSDVPNQSQGTLAVPGLPEVTFDSDDVATTDNLNDPTIVEVACESDLAIAKSAPATVAPGGQMAWTLTVTNHGPSDSSGATVEDTIPAGIANAATSTPGCSVAGAKVTCAVGALAAGASTAIVVTGTAPGAHATCVTNTAAVAGELDDPNPGNNTASATTCTPPPPPPPADVTVDKSASDGHVTVGETVTYRLLVKNNGPGVATGTTVNDTVPGQLDVRSASSTQGDCQVSGNRVSCAIGTLAVGQQARVTVRAQAIRAGGTRNNATVDSPQCTTHPCGKDRVKVRIVKPRLKLTKTTSSKRLRAGQKATYTIRVANPSKRFVRQVQVCDRPPSGLVLVSSKPKAKASRGSHCWTLKRVEAGKAKTIKVVVRALRGTSGRKVNRAVASSPDAKTARASAPLRVIGGQIKAGGVTG